MNDDERFQVKTKTETTSSEREEPIIVGDEASDTLQPKTKKSKKPILLALLIILLLAVGSGAWLMNSKQTATDTSPAKDLPLETNEATEENKLFGVAYSYGDAEKAGAELFWRPIAGGDRRSARNVGAKNYISLSRTHQQKVFVITSPGDGSSEGVVIWYSSDSGKTYEKLHGFDLPEPDKIGDQVTSAVFSKDGSKLLFGHLSDTAKGNTVKQIDLKTKEITDLFSVSNAGVFLQGYDSEKQAVYYFTGCYNCDGNVSQQLLARDLVKNTDAILYDAAGKVGMEHAMSKDLSKMLVLEGVDGEFLGGGPPFSIKEFDINTKAFKELLILKDTETRTRIGYSDSDSAPYFTENMTIFSISTDGSRAALYEATKPIVEVLYVGNGTIIASSGTFEDYMLNNYEISSKKSVEILKGDNSTTLFGVTWE